MEDIEYRILAEEEIEVPLFRDFHRRQVVDQCRRRINGEWVLEADPFIDEWDEKDYIFLVQCLKHTVRSGGIVWGVFFHNELKGFASAEADRIGNRREYVDLTSIHVSEDMRGAGMGRQLFSRIKHWAKEQGAEKLYISAHSAVETQAFYRAMGCVDAVYLHPAHTEAEPYDCQLECML